MIELDLAMRRVSLAVALQGTLGFQGASQSSGVHLRNGKACPEAMAWLDSFPKCLRSWNATLVIRGQFFNSPQPLSLGPCGSGICSRPLGHNGMHGMVQGTNSLAFREIPALNNVEIRETSY